MKLRVGKHTTEFIGLLAGIGIAIAVGRNWLKPEALEVIDAILGYIGARTGLKIIDLFKNKGRELSEPTADSLKVGIPKPGDGLKSAP